MAVTISKLRNDGKLTLQQVAERSGLSVSWLRQLERGEGEPTWASMKDVARGLGISLADLTKEEERLAKRLGQS